MAVCRPDTRDALYPIGSHLILPVHATIRRTLQEMENLLLDNDHLSSLDQHWMHGGHGGELWTKLKQVGSPSWKYLLGFENDGQCCLHSGWCVFVDVPRYMR